MLTECLSNESILINTVLEKTIDYDNVNRIIDKKRMDSIVFLSTALSNRKTK
jgi:hypothetical protein